MDCLLRRTYDAAALVREHPLVVSNANKRTVLELACPAGAQHGGTITVTRWRAAALPAHCELAATEVVCERGHFQYDGQDGVWHVNFADPKLFFAYGSGLLAQDELQALEHPALGAIREALLAEGQPAVTVDDTGPTPVLVAGVERRCELDTSRGLYGNAFARAPAEAVRAALRVLEPPPRSNVLAIAAPTGAPGRYRPDELYGALVTAYTGFRAARAETRGPVEIRTGFWGCGAFGGNRRAMTLLQVLAARLARIDRLRFYAFDDRGAADFAAAMADLERVLGPEQLDAVMARIDGLAYEWGQSDGN